jgi:hypothetical protein
MVAVATVGYEVLQILYSVIKYGVVFNFIMFLLVLLVETLFNVLLVMIFYPILKKVGYYLEDAFKVKQVLTRYY